MNVFINTKRLFSFTLLAGLIASSFLFTSCEKEGEKDEDTELTNDEGTSTDDDSKDDDTTVAISLKKNAIVSLDNQDFDISIDKVSIDAVLSDDLVNDVYDLRFGINESNHVPLIMIIGKLPTESTTLTQSNTKDKYDLTTEEFKIQYVRRKDNKYAYGLTDSIPAHKMNVVVKDNVATFNIAEIELSDASHFNLNEKKFNISFAISIADIKKHEGITVARQYDLAQ